MAEITANGVRFNVHRIRAPTAAPGGTGPAGTAPAGTGPAVIFLHGLVVDNLSSFYYTLAGPAATAGADVILYDLRGHGRSERTGSGYTAGDASADLVALLDALAVRGPVYLAGNSFGGAVALMFALTRPERVAGLVLIETLGAGDRAGAAGEWLENVTNTLTAVAIDLGHRPIADRLERTGERRLARLARSADVLLNGTTLIEDLAALPVFTPAQLGSISCPVLAVYGEHSDLIDAGRALERHIPECALEVLPGLARIVLREAADTIRPLVTGWLCGAAGLSGGSRIGRLG
jgi:pimeloyl-ACP methyl ester carboxylesterase